MARNECVTDERALRYHEAPRAGKISIAATKQFESQCDLSLAYSPGVAAPSMAIARDPRDAYRYTSKGNLVAVVSNGTAVLGLGDIGPLASKPVMEGKAVLFKQFSALDAFDIEVDATDVEHFCDVVAAIAPTFGGINLEDIKAPECFEIERRLAGRLDIPVMHDDQHGTAVVATAALLNASKLHGRELAECKVVIVGAGAAAISSAQLLRHMGVQRIRLIDSRGVVTLEREHMNPYKAAFAVSGPLSTREAFEGADAVLGLSQPGSFTIEDVAAMAPGPIVFAMANPTPEVDFDAVTERFPDAIMATGRSDYDNQINNVLGFPFIFRGAMDVRACVINTEMKVAATHAIAELAREPVPETLNVLYGKTLAFGPNYILPKPFDRRLLAKVSTAVARAAIETGASAMIDFDLDAYERRLETLLDG